MKTKESTTISIIFDNDDRKIISRLVREQHGEITISGILDQMDYVFGWYVDLFGLLRKVSSGNEIILSADEYNVLRDLISTAYNSENEPNKEALKAIADAMEVQRRAIVINY